MEDLKGCAAKVNTYLKANATKILLLAVILTAVLSMKYVAYGKYTSWLADSTQTVAADYCFSSNLLKDATDNINDIQSYKIASWDKSGHTITVEMHNYDNSLRWNETGAALFYYMDLNLYPTDQCVSGEAIGSDVFVLDYNLGSELIEGEDTPQVVPFFGMYKGRNVALIPGNAAYDKKECSQNVYVQLGSANLSTEGLSNRYYLKVDAYSIPYSELENIDCGGRITKADGKLYLDGEEITPNIYEKHLSALFKLGEGSPSARQKYEVNQATTESRVILNITTDVAAEIKIFYNPDKLNPNAEDYVGALKTESAIGSNVELNYAVFSTLGGTEPTIFYKKVYSETMHITDSLEGQFSDYYDGGVFKADMYLEFPKIEGDEPTPDD